MSTPRNLRTAFAGLALASTAAVLPFGARPASAAPPPTPHHVTATVRASGLDGGEVKAGSWRPALSGNGRWFAYTEQHGQSYIKDLLSGATEMVSVNAGGQPADGGSEVIAVSDDGNRVLFDSLAHNLAPAPWSIVDLYVRDRAAHTTTRVNVIQGSPTQVVQADLSGDGNAVAWATKDGKIWTKQLNGNPVRVDVSSLQSPGNEDSGAGGVRLSQDGRYVVFETQASNLVPADLNNTADVFRRDVVAQTTTRVSVAAGGVEADYDSHDASISDDGRYTAFYSYATNLVPGDTNGDSDVFVHDSLLGTDQRLNLTPSGQQSAGGVGAVDISGDGFWVVYYSNANDLAAGDNNVTYDAFARDRFAGKTTVLDTSTGGAISDGLSDYPKISDDGSVTAFASQGANLVAGDTNGVQDAFARVSESMGPHGSLGSYASTIAHRFGADDAAAGWAMADISNGKTTTAHLIVTLAAKAGAHDLAPVSRLYDAFFRRQPDAAGLEYWVKKHQTGTKLSEIATAFAASSEYKTKYGHSANDAFVKLVYQHVLDRQPDGAGLAHWVTKLNGGMSRGDVMVAFSESSEGVRHLAPEVDATVIGLELLEAMPDQALYAQAVAARKTSGVTEGTALVYLESTAYASSDPL